MNLCEWTTNELLRCEEVPSGYDARQAWLKIEDGKGFLQSKIGNEAVLFASTRDVYINSVFITSRLLNAVTDNEVLDWSLNIPGGWGFSYSMSGDRPTNMRLEPPQPWHIGFLSKAEPLFVSRMFEGYPRGKESYDEFNSRLIHSAGLHWMESRSAFSELDEVGDFVDRIRVQRSGRNKVVTGDHVALDPFLYVTKTALVRFFEIHRAISWSEARIRETSRTTAVVGSRAEGFLARKLVMYDAAGDAVSAFLRGFQIIPPFHSRKVALGIASGQRPARQYEQFIIDDWKHQNVRKWSADPKTLGNYHVKSDLPFSTSPAYFKPEVLRKYQADSTKYDLQGGQISCRGAWTLRTYDVNEKGQVHTYICYLGDLPYAEQKHWAQYNEAPKAGISKRAFETDFLAKFPSEEDPMRQLQRALRDFPKISLASVSIEIWSPKLGTLEETFRPVHRVVTDSKEEWTEFMRAMAVAVVEGFQVKALRSLAQHLDCDTPTAGSLKLLKACLLKKDVEAEIVDGIMEPLIELQRLKSGVASHGGASLPEGSLREDGNRRLGVIANGCEDLRRILERGILDS